MKTCDSSTREASLRFVRASGCALCLAVGNPFAIADEEFIRGDVNLDGQINLGDVSRLVASFRADGPALECEDAADVNDDGEIVYESPGNRTSTHFWTSCSPFLSSGRLRVSPAPFRLPGRTLRPTASAVVRAPRRRSRREDCGGIGTA